MEFDYKYYLDTYVDLRHLNEEQARLHWKNHGIYEGRSCSIQKINTETNITIVIHLFNENLFHEFVGYINNVKLVFEFVNVIISLNTNSSFDKTILNLYPSFIVLKVENKGVDVYPFIESIKYIRQHNVKTDFILKLHTKESNNASENCLDWRKELILPITNINNLYVLQHYFKNIESIGYVGSQKCILPKNYDSDFPQNIRGVNELCEKYQHLEKEWTDFVGGNIFWIKYDIINQYLTEDLIQHLNSKFVYGKPPCNLGSNDIYIEYICERMFTGIFCYNKTNIYVNENKGTQRGISINGTMDKSYYYQPSVFSFHTPKKLIT
jgi:hypothetical protein